MEVQLYKSILLNTLVIPMWFEKSTPFRGLWGRLSVNFCTKNVYDGLLGNVSKIC